MRVGEKSYTPCWKEKREISLAPEACVNLKTWISFEEFSALPVTLQKLYVQTQVDKFCVGAAAFGEAWGRTPGRICQIFGDLGIEVPKHTQPEDKLRFMEFVRGEKL